MPLTPVEKGALLGLSNVFTVAIGVALLVVERGRTEVLGPECGFMPCPSFVEPHFGAIEVFLVIVMHGIPCGIALGILAGTIARDHATEETFDRYVNLMFPVLAFVLLGVGMMWGSLAAQMLIPTVIHLVILDRWTRITILDIAPAWVRTSGRPRSTSRSGVRSRGPTPRRSDTSRTIR